MGTLPEKKDAVVRVVGRRAFVEADLDNPNTSYDFGPDGEIVVEETTEVSIENAAATAAAIEQRRAHVETLVDELSPAAYAVHLAMHAALRPHADALESRFAGDPPHLLVAVRVPSDDWYIPASQAFAAVVAGLAADRLAVPTKTASAAPEHDRSVGDYCLSAYSILRHVKNGHVVALYTREEHLPAELHPFYDVLLDLNPIAPRHFELAIQREFDDPGEAGWSPWICQADLDPQLLDSVCSRAGRVGDVVPMLRGVLDARAAAKKRMEAEAARTPAKTTSSNSKTGFRPEVLHPTEPTLDTLYGYGRFATWAKAVAADVADHRAGLLQWEDVDAGCLVEGPPGTGKTFGARALAATCGLPFIPVSFAQWSAAGRSYMGDTIAAMRSTFSAAAEAAPCVLFIDEIDSIPARGRSQSHDDYWVPIVNAMLELLDGTTARPGIIVIAACNNPAGLDPALVRSGRLDRRFTLSLPDEPALLGMMGYHLPGADLHALAPAATVLAGSASAADVARIAREARRAARRENRAVTAQDLVSIAIPADRLSARDRRLVAVHEAGHAVATMVAGRMPDALSIVTADGAHGGVRIEPNLGMGRLVDFENEVIARLAGRAAEEFLLGEPSAGAETDLQVSTSLVVRMLGTTGLGGRLTHGEKLDGNAIEARMRDLYARALRLVGEHRAAVEKLADLALERRVLGRAALEAFAREHGFGGSH